MRVWDKAYKYYIKVHLLFGLLKNILCRILLPPINAWCAGTKISHPIIIHDTYLR